MSAYSGPDAATRSKTDRLVRYLRAEAERSGGELYVKGKHIADDVDLSPHEIGAILSELQDACPDVEVEKWAYTSATTWRVCAR